MHGSPEAERDIMCSAVTFQSKKKKILRVSLRAFFVAFSLLCVWLGFLVNAAHRQNRVVDLVHSLGGSVGYDYQYEAPEFKIMVDHADIGGVGPPPTPPGPKWLRELLGDHYFCDVVTVHLSDSRVTNDVVMDIGKLTSLRSLTLANCPKVTDEGVKHLRTSLPLWNLSLNGTQCSDAGVRHISKVKTLEVLDLGNTPITNGFAEHIRELNQLQYLQVEGTAVSEAAQAELQKTFPGLTIRR